MNGELSRLAVLSLHSCPLEEPGAGDAGGMSVYIRETARELGRRGCRVDVFTRRHGPEHEPIVAWGDNVRLIHIDAGGNERLPKSAVFNHLEEFFLGLESFRLRSGVRYDLVQAHYWLSGCLGLQAGRFWNVPLAMTFHTLGALKNEHRPGAPEPDRRLAWEKKLIRDCDLIVSPSEREKKAVLSLGQGRAARTAVIPCGVDLDLFRPVDRKEARKKIGLGDEEKVLLYVGRLDPVKGLDRLLAAFALLRAKTPLKLLVVGGEGRPPLPPGDGGAADDVVFFGRRPQSELPIYYSAADVFVLPSYYESFGLAGLEALACGVPVAAADVGDYRAILRDETMGKVAADGRPESLAEAIAALLPGAGDRDRVPDIFRAVVGRYSWGRTVDALLGEYRRLADLKTSRTPVFGAAGRR
ncbi:MAG: glycosyltransferase [Pseudomonadota bacterium]